MLTYNYDISTSELIDINRSVSYETDKKTIQELVDHYKSGRINLTPAFQRESVWSEHQRGRLIKSIIENIPIPNIFLYEREENGLVTYDVIDGKQRLESIFMFMGLIGFKRKKFYAKLEWEEDDQIYVEKCKWNMLNDKEKFLFLNYKVQTTTVKCSFSDVSEIFVRINSTGSHLTSQEIRKSKFFKSQFLRRSYTLAERKDIKNFLLNNKILGNKQLLRQKHIELVSELLLSIFYKSPINKKQVIDDALKTDILKGAHLDKVSESFLRTMKHIKKIFPDLYETRFKGLADFYTLFMLVWKWHHLDKYVLTDNKKNKLVQAYLKSFGYNVDRVRDKQKQLHRIEDGEKTFVDYLLTVQSSTDEIRQRKHRENILNSLLTDNFVVKDPFRIFNKEQRRIIWYLSDGKCKICRKNLTINTFHADHLVPHSKGGKTVITNAQILCSEHNLKKGNKTY